MIYLTKMNNHEILLNSDLIESIEETPDTVITMTNGKKLIVMEASEEVYNKIIEFKGKISALNH